MPQVPRPLKWLLKAALFLLLFAFALNNQHEAVLRFAFGLYWQAPMALIVLLAFAAGVAGMLPAWRRRQAAGGGNARQE